MLEKMSQRFLPFLHAICLCLILSPMTFAFIFQSFNFGGEPGAVEMTWMQVPGEKLLEPVVNMVMIPALLFPLFNQSINRRYLKLRTGNYCSTHCNNVQIWS